MPSASDKLFPTPPAGRDNRLQHLRRASGGHRGHDAGQHRFERVTRRSSGTPAKCTAPPTATVTPVQQAILESWLDQGGHTLIVFSQNMVYDLYKGNWTSETNTFLTNYVGAIGSAADGDLNHATYTVIGATGTALAAKVFQVIGDQPIVSSGDTINPATGTDVLGTVVSDADGQLTPAAPDPDRRRSQSRRHRGDVEGRLRRRAGREHPDDDGEQLRRPAVPRNPGLPGPQGVVTGFILANRAAGASRLQPPRRRSSRSGGGSFILVTSSGPSQARLRLVDGIFLIGHLSVGAKRSFS